jgi:hypothetical protein
MPELEAFWRLEPSEKWERRHGREAKYSIYGLITGAPSKAGFPSCVMRRDTANIRRYIGISVGIYSYNTGTLFYAVRRLSPWFRGGTGLSSCLLANTNEILLLHLCMHRHTVLAWAWRPKLSVKVN